MKTTTLNLPSRLAKVEIVASVKLFISALCEEKPITLKKACANIGVEESKAPKLLKQAQKLCEIQEVKRGKHTFYKVVSDTVKKQGIGNRSLKAVKK